MLQEQLDRTEEEIGMHRLEEEFRQSDVRKLKSNIEKLEDVKRGHEKQIKRCEQTFAMSSRNTETQTTLRIVELTAESADLDNEITTLQKQILPLREELEKERES